MCIPDADRSVKPTEEGVDEAAKQEILRLHKKLRSDVAQGRVRGMNGQLLPSASGMLKMVSTLQNLILLLPKSISIFLSSSLACNTFHVG